MLDRLRCDLQTAAEKERLSLCETHRGEVATLEEELGERERSLAGMAAELADARSALEESGRSQGVEVVRLREEVRVSFEKESAAQRKIQQLKVDSLISTGVMGH